MWSGAVISPEEVLTNDYLAARQMIVDVEDPARAVYKMIGCPVKLEKSPAMVTAAPRYGQHTEEFFTSRLGVPSEEVPRAARPGRHRVSLRQV